jgi:hypothetical protein
LPTYENAGDTSTCGDDRQLLLENFKMLLADRDTEFFLRLFGKITRHQSPFLNCCAQWPVSASGKLHCGVLILRQDPLGPIKSNLA